MSRAEQYDGDYFLHGKETGKSLYENYRWLPELTIPMVQAIVDHCGINKGERILDFGCARGYVVKALRGLGYDAWGVDISDWALENADPEVKSFCEKPPGIIERLHTPVDWVIAKDVLEHVEYVERVVSYLMGNVQKGLFVVVPLSRFDNGRYLIADYEKDVTHTQRWTLGTWVKMFLRVGWRVEAAYRVPGVKDNYYKQGWERGNGFITARRVMEDD